MDDSLLYDHNLEETIDLFQDQIKVENYSTLPHFLKYGGPLLQRGKQGLVGFLMNNETNDKYVYKISQYLDFVIDQESNVMKDLNTLRDFCPHFVKIFGKFRVPLTSNYRKSKNPFMLTSEYKSIIGDVIVMQHLDEHQKFFKYIKNKSLSTLQLLSIVKQTLLAVEIANKKLGFTHYDLHSDNIMVGKCDENAVFLYIIDNEYYMVPTYGYYPIIIDFGFSYSKRSNGTQMNCTLAHTKYGFIQCREDKHSDPKIFLTSVSHEINKYKKNEVSQIFRNIVKNLYKDAHVELDCGWDDRYNTSINDDFLEEFDNTFKKSDFFDEQSDYILDLLQTLVVLPLKYRKSNEKTKDLLSLLINEFSKIEKVISDDFYNLFILKEIVISANKNRDLYTSGYTRQDAVNNFKHDILNAVDRIAKFCNLKLNWERLLCSLLCLGKNIENFCYEHLNKLLRVKEKDYSTIPLKTNVEIYNAIEANIPSDFLFTKKTIMYTWNIDKENSNKKIVDSTLIKVLNKTHPLERGNMYKEYVENPELFSKDLETSYKEASSHKERSKESSVKERSKEASSKERSKESSHKERSKESSRKETSSKESSVKERSSIKQEDLD